jgi:hypothetical protein
MLEHYPTRISLFWFPVVPWSQLTVGRDSERADKCDYLSLLNTPHLTFNKYVYGTCGETHVV